MKMCNFPRNLTAMTNHMFECLLSSWPDLETVRVLLGFLGHSSSSRVGVYLALVGTKMRMDQEV